MDEGTSKRLPLAVGPENRDESVLKDAKLVNGYVEVTGKEQYQVYKRPGLVFYTSLATGNGLGVYNWKGSLYSIIGSTMYRDNSVIGTGLDATGIYSFDQCLGGTNKLFFQNGTKAYCYDPSNGLVGVTSSFYPTSTVPGSAYLDATLYVMNSTGNIFGSDLNDPLSWTGDNVILAQVEPDSGVALSKQLVYVVAFKEWSTEIFYDAANAEGSPLGTVQGAKVNLGCRHAGSIQNLEGNLFWISQTRDGGMSVYMMEGLRAVQISTAPIDRLLQEANYSVVYSWGVKVAGHRFYAITLKNSNLTLVYDFTSKQWAQWTDANGNYFPFVSSSYTNASQAVLQHETSGKLYTLEISSPTDDGDLISWDLYTPNFDAGKKTRKVLNYLSVISDQTENSLLEFRFSDDDYTTWSNPRTLNLGSSRPGASNLGTFRRRAFHFHHKAPVPLRIQAVELDMGFGSL